MKQNVAEYDAGWSDRRDGKLFDLTKSKDWQDGWLKRLISSPVGESYSRFDFSIDDWKPFLKRHNLSEPDENAPEQIKWRETLNKWEKLGHYQRSDLWPK